MTAAGAEKSRDRIAAAKGERAAKHILLTTPAAALIIIAKRHADSSPQSPAASAAERATASIETDDPSVN